MKPQQIKLVLTYPWPAPRSQVSHTNSMHMQTTHVYAVHEIINSVEWTPGTRLTRADVEAIIARGNMMVVTRSRSTKD